MVKLNKGQLDKTPSELGMCDKEDCSYINFDYDVVKNVMVCNRCSQVFEVTKAEKKTLKIVRVFRSIVSFISKALKFIFGKRP